MLFSKCQKEILPALQKRKSGKIINQSDYLPGNHMSLYHWTNLGFDRDSELHERFSGISAHHSKYGYS